MKINLIYLSENRHGGWVTYTRHLYSALTLHGCDVRLVKLRASSSSTLRDFGYGLKYASLSPTDIVRMQGYSIIVAIQKNYAGVAGDILRHDRSCSVVLHDKDELKHLEWVDVSGRCVVIRKVNAKLVDGSTYIPHPYIPWSFKPIKKTIHARSICRIDFDKNTDILLGANRLLPSNRKIDVRGFENRLYTKFKLMRQFPEWVQSVNDFPRTQSAAVDLLMPARFAVDMSVIKGDGGGTQYSFLEAIDAGACCVIHDEWCVVKGEMKPGVNCLTAGGAESLAKVLKSTPLSKAEELANSAKSILRAHRSSVVAPQYIELMRGLYER